MLMNGILGFRIAIHVCLVKSLLVILIGSQHLVECDIPHFLRDITSIFIKQHARKVISQVFQLWRLGNGRHFAESSGRRFVQESILGKQIGRIRGASVRHAQGSTSRHVRRGVNIAIALLVHGQFDFCLGTVVELRIVDCLLLLGLWTT